METVRQSIPKANEREIKSNRLIIINHSKSGKITKNPANFAL